MANYYLSRRDRIYSMLVPPDVFLGKRNMTELEILQNKLRHCHTCGRPMKYSEFLRANTTTSPFELDMMQEIWENDIFVINCCSCHKGIPHGRDSDALDAFAHVVARITEEFRREYEQNPLY